MGDRVKIVSYGHIHKDISTNHSSRKTKRKKKKKAWTKKEPSELKQSSIILFSLNEIKVNMHNFLPVDDFPNLDFGTIRNRTMTISWL